MRLHRAALVGLLCAALLMPGATGIAQDLGRGRGRFIERGPADVARLTQRADLIVHGFVTSKEARWIGRVIYTHYDVVVQETLKGSRTNQRARCRGRRGDGERPVVGARRPGPCDRRSSSSSSARHSTGGDASHRSGRLMASCPSARAAATPGPPSRRAASPRHSTASSRKSGP